MQHKHNSHKAQSYEINKVILMKRSLYLTGSSGTGKTTQSLHLAAMTGMSIVDGISRSSPYLMGTSEHQQHVSRRVFKKCMSQKAIHCRCPIDVAAYTKVNKVYSPMDEQHLTIFASTNPIVIYFPMLDHVEEDGFRPTDFDFNRQVDEYILEALERYNITYLALSKNSPEARAEQIIKYWRNYDSQELLGMPGDLPAIRTDVGRETDQVR